MLEPHLSSKSLDTWNTAIQYQMFHSLALFIISGANKRVNKSIKRSQWGFTFGLLLFCGSLYALALGAPTWTGLITPIGGLIWLLSWLNLLTTHSILK